MTTPVRHKITILQGTTQRIPLSRQYVPYAIKGDECSGYVDACTGAPVPPTDFHDEDYTGCEARMQIRAEIGSPVLWEMSTTIGNIELDGKTLLERPLIALAQGEEGGFFKRMSDGALLWWKGDAGPAVSTAAPKSP